MKLTKQMQDDPVFQAVREGIAAGSFNLEYAEQALASAGWTAAELKAAREFLSSI